jgi:hypothetical protein
MDINPVGTTIKISVRFWSDEVGISETAMVNNSLFKWMLQRSVAILRFFQGQLISTEDG